MEKFKLLNQKITYELAVQLCTNISFITFEEYNTLLKNNKLNEAIKLIYQIYDKGYSVMDILDSYFIFIKNTKNVTEEEKYKNYKKNHRIDKIHSKINSYITESSMEHAYNLICIFNGLEKNVLVYKKNFIELYGKI